MVHVVLVEEVSSLFGYLLILSVSSIVVRDRKKRKTWLRWGYRVLAFRAVLGVFYHAAMIVRA